MFLVESRETNNSTELYVFSRKEGKKTLEIVKDFKPYFYVPEDEKIPVDNRITYVERGYKSILGEPLKKVFVNKSKEVPNVRSLFSKHFEADIPFAQRYIIDVVGEVTPYKLKTLYLDIELDTNLEFPDMKTPNQQVISCSFIDNFDNKPFTLLLKSEEHKNLPEESENLKIVNTEEDLLNHIIKYVRDSDPDIVSGWNVETFDLTYLIRRMELLKIDYHKLSPMNYVYINSRYDDVKIKGRIVLDLMRAYKHFRIMSNQGKAERYSLEFTAREVLGIGKISHEETFHDLWINKPKKFVEYNVRDVTLCNDIDKELQIIDFFNSIRARACAQLEDIYKTTALLDGAFLRIAKDKYVLPSKNTTGGEKYAGAFVFETTPGIYNNIITLDLKSLYPNIIKTFNMGFDTFNKDGEIKITENIAFNKGIGLISRFLRDLQSERDKYKKIMRTAKDKHLAKVANFRQYAVKVLMNSSYGFLGASISRLYKREVAFAITYMGQKIIKFTADWLTKRGYKVIAGDTDSVFVRSKFKSTTLTVKDGERLAKEITDAYVDFVKSYGSDDCTLELEFEKVFKSIIFVKKKSGSGGAKKRYAYILSWKDGKYIDGEEVGYTGFDGKRSDSPRIARDVQKNVIRMILTGVSKEKVINYITEIDKKIKDGLVPADEFGFPKGISEHLKDYAVANPVVTGAIYSNKYLGTRFTKGSKPYFTYIKAVPKGFPKTHVITYDEKLPKGFIPDFDKITERIFKMKLESIFEAAGFGEFPELNNKTTSLSEWIK